MVYPGFSFFLSFPKRKIKKKETAQLRVATINPVIEGYCIQATLTLPEKRDGRNSKVQYM